MAGSQATMDTLTAAVQTIAANWKTYQNTWKSEYAALVATEKAHHDSNPNHASLPADRAAIAAKIAAYETAWHSMRANRFAARKAEHLYYHEQLAYVDRNTFENVWNADQRAAHMKKYPDYEPDEHWQNKAYQPETFLREYLP